MRFTFCFRVLPILVFFISSCFYIRCCVCEPRATEAALICTNRTAPSTERQTFVSNFLAALDTVTPLIERQKYAAVVNGTGNLTVYAFGECMKDLDQTDCNLCFAQCKTQILRCLPFQRGIRGGRLFFDGCYLRYDDYYFFNESLSSQDRKVCNSTNFTGNRTVFSDNALELVRNLSVQAQKNDGFFVGFVNRKNVTVYGLAQCWELVNGTACEKCLDAAVSEIGSCLPNDEGRVLNSGCYLRYSTHKFYNNTGSVATGGSGGRGKLAKIVAVTSSVVAFVLIVAATIFFVKINVVKKRRERKRLGPLLATVNNSKLNFSYKTLEKATNYFHQSNKLGQGGSGSVYKGTLPDGRIVAIKRLFFNTNQWVDHFFNEVDLISGIKHKNLAELLGCSVTGPESLLVYEYVPNQSLYDYLFVRKDVPPLSWEARYSIIAGTAEGLAFLHEESNFRIIHRDIKLSNVLLDDKLTPKIADFGLARLFPEDKTHISTGIAGTLGYMAPEYVVLGKLSEKADVYSFGVLLIEVVCGKKNNSFSQDSVSMLHMVWNLYRTGRLHEAVDPVLKGYFREDEATRLFQIGLICVQASAEVRPCMSKVVKMLFENQEIPQPTQPPFLNPSSAEFSHDIRPVTVTSSSGSYFQSSGNSASQSYIEPR